MADNDTNQNKGARNVLAYGTFIFSVSAITILAATAIINDTENKNTMAIFNIVLPVFASWVGTVLAFYFGRENFESANKQVRELVQKLTPEQRAKALVTSIMRSLSNMVHHEIPKGQAEKDIKISELMAKFAGNVSRLPIIDSDKKPKYMIHESRIDKYLASGGKQDDSLEQFISSQKVAGVEYGLDKGFIIVSEETTLAAANSRLEDTPSVQDIFITKGGGSDEPLIGWISNLRMAKFLEK
jgi:hypothetical protein